MKRNLNLARIFTIVLIIFFLSSCNTENILETTTPSPTPTFTPEELYITSITEAIDEYSNWVSGSYADVQNLLDENSSAVSACLMLAAPNGLSCLELDSIKDDITPLMVPLQTAFEEAYLLKTQFGGLNPPSEVVVSHQQILDCLDYEILRLNFFIEGFSGNLIDIPETSPCQMMDMAINQIQDYVEDNN